MGMRSWFAGLRARSDRNTSRTRHRLPHHRKIGVEALEARLVLSDVFTLSPPADAHVRGTPHAAKNFGTATRLIVRNETGEANDYESFLRFALPPTGGTIESATLRLVPATLGRSVGSATFRVRTTDDAGDTWLEGNGGADNQPAGEIAWSRRPIGSGAAVTFPGTQLLRNQALAIDVTALLNQRPDGNGLASFQIDSLVAGVRREVQFYSRENRPNLRPVLQLTISPANGLPTAAADRASTAEDAAATIAVLANDTDPDGDPVTLLAASAAGHGSVVANADGTVTYTPQPNFFGDDGFSYRITDGQGGTATGAVTIVVTPINDVPAAHDDRFAVPPGTATNLAVTGNDGDVDGDVLRVTSVAAAAHGSVVINADNTLTYTPAAGYRGRDSFGYTLSDGTVEDTAEVSLAVQRTPEEIQRLTYDQFRTLIAAEVPELTAAQMATIPSEWWFKRMSGEARAALTPAQVQAVNTAAVGLSPLTATQIGQLLPAQIQQVNFRQFRHLSPGEVPALTAAQMGTIDSEWWFKQMSAEARAALSAEQVQGLNVAAVGLSGLTPAQIGQLAVAQIQQVHYSQFGRLSAGEVPHLTTTQIASIENEWWFKQMSAETRAALTASQVQGINVSAVGISGLTPAQIGQLAVAQIQQVHYSQFGRLSATEVPHLTTTQIAAIENEWWFKQMSAETRAALTPEQVQAINVPAVGISGLTTDQIGQLTVAQVQQVNFRQFGRLTTREVPVLTTTQIAAIENEWWFKQMSAETRAALTSIQVQAINVPAVGISGLTPTQVGELTIPQIQQVNFRQVGYLSAQETPHLTPAQLASIENDWWFTRMNQDARAALGAEQVQALNTAAISLIYLTPGQREDLTATQIQTVRSHAFKLLSPEQVVHLTNEQLAAISDTWRLLSMPDESLAALSPSQLLSLSPRVQAQSVGLPGSFAESKFPHASLTCGEAPDPNLPHSDNLDKQHEHTALFDLVPREAATHVTIASGNWSDAAIWRDGTIPTLGARVLVAAGHVVTFDAIYVNPLETVRVDGTLTFATQYDTQLLADTIVVDGRGVLRVGTAAQPIDAGVAARIVIADTGPIDLTWDPNQLSRGLISHGTVEMYGQTVTPYVALAVPPRAGATQLVLETAPLNWAVGHRVVLTGSHYDQHEELEVTGIDGNVVTVDHALRYHHTTPAGYDVSHYLTNTNRNVVVMSQDVDINSRRGHVMFMHGQNVQVHNVGFYGLGRTDKRNPVNDPVFDEDCQLLDRTGLNRRGRYAVHFHRTGIDATRTPAEVSGSVVVDSPGWGFVNHESNVHMTENVAFNVVGAGFVTEVGDEIGSFRRNLAVYSTGSGESRQSREDIFDFGHGGHGFWFQGPGVEVEGNIASGHRDAAFIFFTASSEAEFDAANLTDPSLAAGHTHVPVGSVPLRLMKDNTAFASASGLETWFHLTNATAGQSHIDGFTAWNTHRPIFIPYTGRTTIQDAVLIGSPSNPAGTGISRNNVTNNITYHNVHLNGFEVGISAPVRRGTVIEGGHFETVIGIKISTTEHNNRTVDIVTDPATGQDPEFVTLSTERLHGRTQWDIFMDGTPAVKHNDIETLFAPDVVRLGMIRLNGKQLYYHKQAADFVPFPTSGEVPDELLSLIPPELVGKTNQELWDQFGLAPAGIIAPADAVEIERINGLVGDPSVYPPELALLSPKYINRLESYELVYINGDGDLVHDATRADLREGWNLVTRQIHGVPRTFFVFGDTEAPTFQLSPETKLVINPLGLDFGFTVRGTVLDNSFGSMLFHKKFTDLRERPVLTRPDGTEYILLEFPIRDYAGNTTIVSLELTLDPNAPVIQGTDQRDLPPRELPTTLYELLEYYMITGQTDLTDLTLPPVVL